MENFVNKVVSRYQILEEVGRGGMAVVYKARDLTLGRIVALKVLPPQFTFETEFVQRFLHEARTAATLDHPNIVTIYDVGEANGFYYIAMKYIEGRSLRKVIEQEGALDLARVTRIIGQVANALDYAHQGQIVHRDVKPSNILLHARGQAILSDFGIAKAAAGTRLTRTGILVGTPEYMSPEQARGGELDWRTDIYSLGIVCYEMLTGRVPFAADTPHAILHAHIYEPPPPLRSINPQIPPIVEESILKALAKNPEERYPSAGGLVQALIAGSNGIRVGEPAIAVAKPAVQPAETPTVVKLPRPAASTSRLPAILGGILAILVLAATALMLGLPREASTPIAVTPTYTRVATATTMPVAKATATLVRATTPTTKVITTPVPATTTPIIVVVTATPLPAKSPTQEIVSPKQYPAPRLLSPQNGTEFAGERAVIVLKWESVGPLGSDEYYVVSIPHTQGVDEGWTKDTQWQVPAYMYTLGFPSREYRWSVVVRRHTGFKPNGQKDGPSIGEVSTTWAFRWHTQPTSPLPRP